MATVHNTGGRALDMNGTLRLLDGPGGLSAGPFPAALGTTLGIGDTEPVTVVLDSSCPLVRGTPDHVEQRAADRSAHAGITFPATGTSAPVATDPPPPGWLAAIAALLVLVLALATLLVWLRRLRRLRGRRTDHGAFDHFELVPSHRAPG